MADHVTDEFIRIQAALAGRYSLQRELGRGGMGIVYLAHDVALERPVALKVLQPALASQAAVRQRFLNEARTAAKLSHPNITPIFAADEADGFVFFVMAYVEGGTLGERIRTRGPVPPSELAKILREVGWALAYAHAQGVVHRDVKADNIMIERASGRALVVDFGIARVLQDSGVTGVGEVLGTPDYMSPEQASGEGADHRSDIYSLGVVAFYALTGRLPFEGATVGALLAKHITQAAPPVAESVPGLPAKLSDAIDRCLAKDPAERFPDAEALADAVGTALASRREPPLPIQRFVKGAGDVGQNLVWLTFFQLSFLATAGLFALIPGRPAVEFWLVLAAALLAADPVLGGGILGHVRALLKSGYTRDDLAAVWDRVVQSAREKRAVEHGLTAGPLERAARGSFVLGWGALLAAVVAGPTPFTDLIGPWVFMAANGGGGLALWLYDGRTGLSQRLAKWFVKSRLGRWAFGLAGLGLDRSALASMATHRPTELVIGMAVDALFDALPKATRRQLSDLPSVMRNLEEDATTMRRRVEQLDELTTSVDPGTGGTSGGAAAGGVLQRRDALDRDLTAAREAARRRLADAVTALETIRLDLLRLTAGAVSVDSLTADLADARAVSEQVRRLIDARDDVEALLSRDTGSSSGRMGA